MGWQVGDFPLEKLRKGLTPPHPYFLVTLALSQDSLHLSRT